MSLWVRKFQVKSDKASLISGMTSGRAPFCFYFKTNGGAEWAALQSGNQSVLSLLKKLDHLTFTPVTVFKCVNLRADPSL